MFAINHKYKYRPLSSLLPSLLIASLIFISTFPVFSVQVYDQDGGTYTDDFADAAGISSKSNVDVDATSTVLKLTDSGGGFTPPYNNSGYAITSSIIPISVAKWNHVTFTAINSTSTSVRVQVLSEDDIAFSDSLLPGNSAGFTSSSIDLTNLPVEKIAGNNTAKFGRLRLKFILSTTDTAYTPILDGFTLSWTAKQGDLSASPLAGTAWPIADIDKQGTRHSLYYSNPVYPAIRWVSNQGIDYGGATTRGFGNVIYNKTQGGIVSWPTVSDGKLSAINRDTGAVIWQKSFSGNAFSDVNHALSQDGSLYISDIFHDIFLAYDSSDGSLKWTYQFGGGHGNQNVAIGDDGTIYTARQDQSATSTIYAFNPDGSIKWTYATSTPDSSSPSQSQIVFDSSRLYFGTSNITGGTYLNTGRLYALNQNNGSLAWSYPTGDIHGSNLVVGPDGTVYAAKSASTEYVKKIYAINSDGTLKWERDIGITTDAYYKLSLRTDNILLAQRASVFPTTSSVVEAVSIADGSLLWSQPVESISFGFTPFFSDGLNGFYVGATPAYQATSSVLYFDANRNQKWSLSYPNPGKDMRFVYGFVLDESGRLYGTLLDNSGPTSFLYSLFPWTLSVSTSPSRPVEGDTVTFTATTAMQPTNLFIGEVNKMQVVLDNGIKIPLTYDSTASSGDTVWRGTYTVPVGLSSVGTRTFRVEASAAGITTDIPVYFDSPAKFSGNTGIIISGSFTVAALSRIATIIASPVPAPPASPAPAPAGPVEIPALPANPTAADYNRVISAMLQQVAYLRGLLAVSQQGGVQSATSFQFSRNMGLGSFGEDARQIQLFLKAQGSEIYPEGLVTGYFGPLTRAAVGRFQIKYGIVAGPESPGYGQAGPKTRAKINEMSGAILKSP